MADPLQGPMAGRWSWLGELAPWLPPAFGALVGLRWTRDQSPGQRLASFAGGFGLAVWVAPAIAELLELGPRATVAAGVLTAIAGMDLLAGVMAAVAAFKADPPGAVRAWWSAWRGRP